MSTDLCGNYLEEESLTNFIKTINNGIKKQDLKIIKCKCELSEDEFLVLICTANDNINKLQNHYTQNELQFYNDIFHEIVTDDDHRLKHIYCLNMSSSISHSNSEVLLNKWIENGYFVQKNGFIYFGAKTIQEFHSIFHNDYKDYINICGLCNEIVLNVCFLIYLNLLYKINVFFRVSNVVHATRWCIIFA